MPVFSAADAWEKAGLRLTTSKSDLTVRYFENQVESKTAMGTYGEAAILATKYAKSLPPRAAWNRAIAELSGKDSIRAKRCPRGAYLGLCEAGLVAGIKAGEYEAPTGNKNGRYAVDAVNIL